MQEAAGAPQPEEEARAVVDASVVLAWYLPAEPHKDQALTLLGEAAAGRLKLYVPSLTRYEVLNALSLAVRGIKRTKLSTQQAHEILQAFDEAGLEERGIAEFHARVLDLAALYYRSAYDAAYLALAEHLGADLLTGDAAFYRAVRGKFPRVKLVGGRTD